MDTVVCKLVGPLFVVVNGPTTITDADWDRALASYAQHYRSYQGILVWSLGATPNASQRLRAAKFWESRVMPKTAVVAGTLARGVVTAMNWVMGNNGIKAFAPNQLQEALDFLNLGVSANVLEPTLAAMRRQVDASAA